MNVLTLRWLVRAVALIVSAATVSALAARPVPADTSDEYPIPSSMFKTTCAVDQYMAAVRDTNPVNYERYMIDCNNKSSEVQTWARDQIASFFSMDYAGRRTYSKETATDAFQETLAWK